MGKRALEAEVVEKRIVLIRGQKVMLDRHLAALYGVPTRYLNRAVARNSDRFPPDFMFRLTRDEWAVLKSQIGISRWGGDRALPAAFTEHGVAMLSSVLRSGRAAQANVAIMRAFVRLRRLALDHADLAKKVAELEKTVVVNTADIRDIFSALRKMIHAPDPPRKPIGFRPD